MTFGKSEFELLGAKSHLVEFAKFNDAIFSGDISGAQRHQK